MKNQLFSFCMCVCVVDKVQVRFSHHPICQLGQSCLSANRFLVGGRALKSCLHEGQAVATHHVVAYPCTIIAISLHNHCISLHNCINNKFLENLPRKHHHLLGAGWGCYSACWYGRCNTIFIFTQSCNTLEVHRKQLGQHQTSLDITN